MYCAGCGVKLADTEIICPLCGLQAYHPHIDRPDAEPLYPSKKHPAAPHHSPGGAILLTIVFIVPLLIVLLCNLEVNGAVTWSGYVTGALVTSYVIFVLPAWFRKPNPVIFVPCGFAAVGLYLLYINLTTGGSWFLGFAFPVTGGICLITTATVTLLRYVSKGRLYICGGSMIALGLFMPLMEFLLNFTFSRPLFFGWSFYPMAVLVMLGFILIFLAICRPARDAIARRVFF